MIWSFSETLPMYDPIETDLTLLGFDVNPSCAGHFFGTPTGDSMACR